MWLQASYQASLCCSFPFCKMGFNTGIFLPGSLWRLGKWNMKVLGAVSAVPCKSSQLWPLLLLFAALSHMCASFYLPQRHLRDVTPSSLNLYPIYFQLSSRQRLSSQGPWTHSISICWELVRSRDSWVAQICWIRSSGGGPVSVLMSLPGISCFLKSGSSSEGGLSAEGVRNGELQVAGEILAPHGKTILPQHWLGAWPVECRQSRTSWGQVPRKACILKQSTASLILLASVGLVVVSRFHSWSWWFVFHLFFLSFSLEICPLYWSLQEPGLWWSALFSCFQGLWFLSFILCCLIWVHFALSQFLGLDA